VVGCSVAEKNAAGHPIPLVHTLLCLIRKQAVLLQVWANADGDPAADG